MENRNTPLAEMQVDLLATELMVLVMLANMGHAMLSGDRDAAKSLGEMLMELPGGEETAMSALQKLEASMKLAVSLVTPDEGLS